MSTIKESEILNLVKGNHRWIDVRAPIEFNLGSIPSSVNFPILSDEERHLVGTSYKKEGREKAIELGYQLVSGANRDQKIKAWIDFINEDPENTSLFCFRGGLRSQISQQWLKDRGVTIRRVEGGYKQMRFQMVRQLETDIERVSIRLISGSTGSWKTHLIRWLIENKQCAIDLEEHALHRGSAFGKKGKQPAQIDFEHAIVKDSLHQHLYFENDKPLYLEDESRLIGRCIIPDFLFKKMRESPILLIDESLEKRVENIFYDYIECSDIARSSDITSVQLVYKGFRDALNDIKKRLGLEKFGEIYKDILHSETQSITRNSHESNRVWIQKLLVSYYDPLYTSSLARRNPMTLVKGNVEDIKGFISK